MIFDIIAGSGLLAILFYFAWKFVSAWIGDGMDAEEAEQVELDLVAYGQLVQEEIQQKRRVREKKHKVLVHHQRGALARTIKV